MRSLAINDYSYVLLKLLFVLTLQLTTTPSVMIQDVESFTLPVRSSSVRRRRLPIHTTTTTSASTTPLTVGYLTVSPEKEEGRGKGSDVPHGNGKDDEEQQQQQELQQQQPHQIHNMTTITTENENDNDIGECNRSKVHALELENEQLRQTISKLQDNVEEYRKSASVTNSKLVLENFEGEFSGTADAEVALMRGDEEAMERWCDSLPDGSCPVEPKVSFGEALRDRALWLIGLLLFQSASGIILAHNEELLIKHPISKYTEYRIQYAAYTIYSVWLPGSIKMIMTTMPVFRCPM